VLPYIVLVPQSMFISTESSFSMGKSIDLLLITRTQWLSYRTELQTFYVATFNGIRTIDLLAQMRCQCRVCRAGSSVYSKVCMYVNWSLMRGCFHAMAWNDFLCRQAIDWRFNLPCTARVLNAERGWSDAGWPDWANFRLLFRWLFFCFYIFKHFYFSHV
jgi:hypothetical protein